MSNNEIDYENEVRKVYPDAESWQIGGGTYHDKWCISTRMIINGVGQTIQGAPQLTEQAAWANASERIKNGKV